MRLYLSSYRMGSDPSALRRLVGDGDRAGVVMNAGDAFEEPRLVWPRERDDLAALGFTAEEVDLRDHAADPGGLRERLSTLDLLWVVGGNTYVLLRTMDACGFGDTAGELVRAGALTYAGYSAGVCAITPDLAGIHLMDHCGDSAPDRPGLGWVPWRVVPHWRSDHRETGLADLAVEHLLVAGLPFRTLRDGEALVIDD